MSRSSGSNNNVCSAKLKRVVQIFAQNSKKCNFTNCEFTTQLLLATKDFFNLGHKLFLDQLFAAESEKVGVYCVKKILYELVYINSEKLQIMSKEQIKQIIELFLSVPKLGVFWKQVSDMTNLTSWVGVLDKLTKLDLFLNCDTFNQMLKQLICFIEAYVAELQSSNPNEMKNINISWLVVVSASITGQKFGRFGKKLEGEEFFKRISNFNELVSKFEPFSSDRILHLLSQNSHNLQLVSGLVEVLERKASWEPELEAMVVALRCQAEIIDLFNDLKDLQTFDIVISCMLKLAGDFSSKCNSLCGCYPFVAFLVSVLNSVLKVLGRNLNILPNSEYESTSQIRTSSVTNSSKNKSNYRGSTLYKVETLVDRCCLFSPKSSETLSKFTKLLLKASLTQLKNILESCESNHSEEHYVFTFDTKTNLVHLAMNSLIKLNYDANVKTEGFDSVETIQYLVHMVCKIGLKNRETAEQILNLVLELVSDGNYSIPEIAASDEQQKLNPFIKCWLNLQKLNDFELNLGCCKLRELCNASDCQKSDNLKVFCSSALTASLRTLVLSEKGHEISDISMQSVLSDMKFVIGINLMTESEVSSVFMKLFNGLLRKPGTAKLQKAFDWYQENIAPFLEPKSMDFCNIKFMEGILLFVEHLHSSSSNSKKYYLELLASNCNLLFNNFDSGERNENECSKNSNQILSLEKLILWINAACVLDFHGLQLHSLRLWTLVATKMFKRDLEDLDKSELLYFDEIYQFVRFNAFMASLRCGSLELASKFCCDMKTIFHVSKGDNSENFFDNFIQLKWDCINKRRDLEKIILDVLALIDLDALHVWAFFKTSLCVDFLVVLLAEHGINNVITKSDDVVGDYKSNDLIFFTKWKAEAFRHWKSFIPRSIVTPSDTKPLLPLFLDTNSKNLLCALIVPSFAHESYSEFSFMLKTTGLVDLARNYDSFICNGGYFNKHPKLEYIYSNLITRASIEVAFCYAYVGQFDKCYETLAQVVYKMIGCEFDPESLLANSASQVSTNEIGDVKSLKAQEHLSENLSEIPVQVLLESYASHEVECMCVLCSNVVKNENVILTISLYETIPRKPSYGTDAMTQTFVEKINKKLLVQSNLLSSYLRQHGFGKVGTVKNGTLTKANSCELDKSRDNFVAAYNCTGSVPSLDNFRMFSFGCTKLAAEAIFTNACPMGEEKGQSSESSQKQDDNGKIKSKSSKQADGEKFDNSLQLIEALDNLALVASSKVKRKTNSRFISKPMTPKFEQSAKGTSITKTQRCEISKTGKENCRPPQPTRKITKDTKTNVSKTKTKIFNQRLQPLCDLISSSELSKRSQSEECPKMSCLTPTDVRSRLVKCQLEISSDFKSWAYDLITLINKLRDFRLVRGLARTNFCDLMGQFENFETMMSQVISASINPTALNVFLHHRSGTETWHLDALGKTFRKMFDRSSPECGKLADGFTGSRLLEMLPRNWIVVSVSDSFKSKVRIALFGQNLDTDVLEVPSFDELIANFVDALNTGAQIDETLSKKNYWKQRFSAEDKLKDIVSLLNQSLNPLHEKMSTFGNIKAVILIVDNKSSCIPWEHLDCLRNYPVGRYPSLEFFCRHLAMHQSKIENPVVQLNRGFYLLNPGGDLLKTEKNFENFFETIQKPSFDGFIRSEPSLETMKSKLEDSNLYVYCGHGAGSKYYPAYFLRDKVRNLNNCVPMLMGCSSGAVCSLSDYLDPTALPLDFLLAGSPAVVATLWRVSDNEIDLFTKALMQQICIMKTENECIQLDSSMEGKGRASDDDGSLSKIVKECQSAVKLQVSTGHAPIVFGLPVLKFE